MKLTTGDRTEFNGTLHGRGSCSEGRFVMRYLVGFGALLVALGVFRLVGCSEETPLPLECVQDEDCDDANECTDDSCVEKQRWFEGKYYGRCENRAVEYGRCDFDGLDDILGGLDGVCVAGVCEKNPCDDGNECTLDEPSPVDDSCDHGRCSGCQPCDRNGEPGVCIGGVCEEYPCNDGVICEDGDLCTYDFCDYTDGMCDFNPVCLSGQCRVASCDPTDGSCTFTPVPDGTPCSGCGERACHGGVCVCVGTCFCIP